MKAAVFLGPGRFEIREIPRPRAEKGEAVIAVKSCAVCGTDLRVFRSGHKKVKPPQVTGHEIAGVIAETGSGVDGFKPGDRVTVVTSVGCGRCRFCRAGRNNICPKTEALGYFYPGGFAEYVRLPAESVAQNALIHVPEEVGFDEASLVEPLSCCINGQSFLDISEGERVLVFGAGPIGLMHLELARARGAGELFLVDISAERLESARRIVSFDHAINGAEKDPVAEVERLTGGEGIDVIITATPAGRNHEQALSMAAVRGRISLFGGLPKDDSVIRFDSNIVHYRELSVFGVFASARADYEAALELVVSGRVDSGRFISHRLPLEKIGEALKLIQSGRAVKVVLNP